ncbi:MAG: hypothetical protein GTO63_25695, partial [Anaerolineae bacterium]|nr:hypothetical protein [Anaerolineae bacterium]NIN98129.1 hypothetical protein [Anaerolineae bacterium]NIQ81058.1 hypothetical protein [Anaerolineae bacterium]
MPGPSVGVADAVFPNNPGGKLLGSTEFIILEVLKEFMGADLDDETLRSIYIRLKHFEVDVSDVVAFETEDGNVGVKIHTHDGMEYVVARVSVDAEDIEEIEEYDDDGYDGDASDADDD